MNIKPSEKFKQLRLLEGLSQKDFGLKYNLEDHNIRQIEKELTSFSDELAMILEEEYKIPFKWWKTGEGPETLELTPEEEKTYTDGIGEIAKELNIPKESFEEILQVLAEEPELISYAVKAVRGNKTARERFLKLTE